MNKPLPSIGYRPIPRDFAETFARVGWEGIEAECRAHKTTIKRWMVQIGEDGLRQARREWLEQHYATNLGGKRIPGARPGRAKRYVLGRTLKVETAVIVVVGEE